MDTRRILQDLADIDAHMDEVAARSESNSDIATVAFAVHNLVSCVERIVEGIDAG